jgi:hypothetical protein
VRWTIDSNTRDGLKVISEIPDISPCLLEGRNGIGKTVAIQLLQLISGEIPEDFRTHPSLWSSLGERLGGTAVSVSQLQDERSLSVTFTPDQWDTTVPEAVGEWLGKATIDGQPAGIKACAALISVIRIAGDEDLEATLQRRVDTLKAYLQTAAQLIRDRGDQIENELGDIRTDLQRADPEELGREAQMLVEIEQQLRDAANRATTADRRLNRLLQALETKRQLEAAGQAADALLTRREELVDTVKRLEDDLTAKEEQAGLTDKALAAEGHTQKKLADSERLLRHRRSRLANLEREVERIATRLSVPPDAAAISNTLADVELQARELAARYRDLDSTSFVRDLIAEIVVPLESAQEHAGGQILVKTDEGGLTVSQTLAGVTTRRHELLGQPQPAQLRELASQIDAAKHRQLGLRSFAAKVEEYNRQLELVYQAEQEATATAAQAEQASDAARLSREANQAVGAAQLALTKTHAELASVQQQIGATGIASKEDAETDLRAALVELGLVEAELISAEGAARAVLAEADRTLTDLASSASAIRRRLTVRQTDTDLVIDRLIESHQHRWLLDASPDLATSLADPETRYAAFARLRMAVLQASESAFDAADFLTGLVGIAEDFFRDRHSANGDLVQPLRHAFEAVLGHRLRQTLNRPSIRAAIFDGSEVVRIEPASRQLTLRDANGDETQRPMEAFSTGERAFAFTQARIADLEPPENPNRLLVLDEFGAFVAADRLPDLASFLAEDVGRVADQVVVVLPLTVDYEAEIGDTRGELRARYEERLAQITVRGYCAVTLE